MNDRLHYQEMLHQKALSVMELSTWVTQRGLAHAFVEYSAHVMGFTAKLMPLDTPYLEKGHDRKPITEIRVELSPYEFLTGQRLRDAFIQQYQALDEYAERLRQMLMASNQQTPSTETGGNSHE